MKIFKVLGLMLALLSLSAHANADTYWGNFSNYGCWEGKPGYAKYAAVLHGILMCRAMISAVPQPA